MWKAIDCRKFFKDQAPKSSFLLKNSLKVVLYIFFCSLREIQSQSIRSKCLNLLLDFFTEGHYWRGNLGSSTVSRHNPLFEGRFQPITEAWEGESSHEWSSILPMMACEDSRHGISQQFSVFLTHDLLPSAGLWCYWELLIIPESLGSVNCRYSYVEIKYHCTFYSKYQARLSIIVYMDLSWDLGVPKKGLPIWVEKDHHTCSTRVLQLKNQDTFLWSG